MYKYFERNDMYIFLINNLRFNLRGFGHPLLVYHGTHVPVDLHPW